MPNPQQRTPILQFTGSLNISSNDLQDGYYVIMGSMNPKKPLAASVF